MSLGMARFTQVSTSPAIWSNPVRPFRRVTVRDAPGRRPSSRAGVVARSSESLSSVSICQTLSGANAVAVGHGPPQLMQRGLASQADSVAWTRQMFLHLVHVFAG